MKRVPSWPNFRDASLCVGLVLISLQITSKTVFLLKLGNLMAFFEENLTDNIVSSRSFIWRCSRLERSSPRSTFREISDFYTQVCSAHTQVCSTYTQVCSAHTQACSAHTQACSAHTQVCSAHAQVCSAQAHPKFNKHRRESTNFDEHRWCLPNIGEHQNCSNRPKSYEMT